MVGDLIVVNNVHLWDFMSLIEKVQIGCGWCCIIVLPSMVFESMAQQNLFCLTPRTRCYEVLMGIDCFWVTKDVFFNVG
jgi:hypothetical protein